MPVSGSTGYRSGFLNNPPKVLLNNRDCAHGSYPTILRTGDPDFSGKSPSVFDDNLTVIYAAASESNRRLYGEGSGRYDPLVQYPLMFPKDYPLTSTGSSASPNISSSIIQSAPVLQQTTDGFMNYWRPWVDLLNNQSGSEKISPFNDSRLNFGTSSFYRFGIYPHIIPGFYTSPRDSTQLVIDLNPTNETSIFWSTGTTPHSTPYSNRDLGLQAGINPGIAYFNWGRKTWEIIGDTTTGSNVDFGSYIDATRTGSYQAFPNGHTGIAFGNPGFRETAGSSGSPSNVAGFPLASKFDATGSQLLRMSDYINQPFLVYGMLFEWTGSVNTYPLSPDGDAGVEDYMPQTSNFFILNQFEAPVSRSVSTGNTFYRDGSSGDYTIYESGPFDVRREKDLVMFSSIVRSVDRSRTDLANWERRSLVLVGGNGTDAEGGITGSFVLPGRTMTPGIYKDAVGPIVVGRYGSGKSLFVGSPNGGRDMFGANSGRSYVASVVGATPSGSEFSPGAGNNQQYVQPYANISRPSPYVLLPTDQLVLGFVNQPGVNSNSTNYNASWSERTAAATQRVVMAPGPSKLTLFGSMIQFGWERNVTTNQPLVSDAIHETLHELVVDQFQVDPFYTYTGSYIDEVYAGSFFKGSPRGVYGRCTEGTQGTTGSLLRGVKLYNANERYYDSLMPKLSHYFKNSAVSGTVLSPKNVKNMAKLAYYFSGAMSISDPGELTNLRADASLPFPYVGNPERTIVDNAFLVVSASANDDRFEALNEYGDIKRALFGVGYSYEKFTGLYKSKDAENTTQTLNDIRANGAQGFRYGVANTKKLMSEAVFRYDRCGQFRDMLEQRHDTRFFDDDPLGECLVLKDGGDVLGSAPVSIIFVDEYFDIISAEQTYSQNLSPFSTSSLPYFDGHAVDRTDDPYKTPDIIISEIDEV